jgi:hypothetical protein
MPAQLAGDGCSQASATGSNNTMIGWRTQRPERPAAQAAAVPAQRQGCRTCLRPAIRLTTGALKVRLQTLDAFPAQSTALLWPKIIPEGELQTRASRRGGASYRKCK